MSFIPAEYYQTIYLIIVLILSIHIFRQYYHFSTIRLGNHSDNPFGLLLMLLFISFIGTRPISDVFADMGAYRGLYNRWSGPFEFRWDTDNKIWDNLNYWLASIQFDPIYYYILIALIYFGCIYWACWKMFPNDKVAAFLVYLGAFSTFSYGTNGLKAGCAAAIFLVALAYRENLKICIPLALVSLGFHHSMQLPLAALAIVIIYHKPKYYFYIWGICLILAALHITYFQNLFASITDEHGAGYLVAEGDEIVANTGFRLDFIVYSAMPVWMGWHTIHKIKNCSNMYLTLLCLYLLTNSVWMLCVYASFTNRIAYLSWLMYPFVLIYPLLKESFPGNRYKFFVKVTSIHLGFTLFMHFVYYS